MAIERAPELERFAEEGYQAYRRGDVDFIERTLSHDDAVLVVGTDPDEVWSGHNQVIDALRTDIATMSEEGAPESIHRDRVGYHEGDVGWVYNDGAFRLSDGTEIPTRGLSVLHRENGEWKYVQSLFSIAVPNSALRAESPLAQALSAAMR
jgi:hypothetical protein